MKIVLRPKPWFFAAWCGGGNARFVSVLSVSVPEFLQECRHLALARHGCHMCRCKKRGKMQRGPRGKTPHCGATVFETWCSEVLRAPGVQHFGKPWRLLYVLHVSKRSWQPIKKGGGWRPREKQKDGGWGSQSSLAVKCLFFPEAQIEKGLKVQ